MHQPRQILILSPFYNDEASFTHFAADLEKTIQSIGDCRFSFLVINDGSTGGVDLRTTIPLTLVHLHRNIGHQKSIAIGLAYAEKNLNFDCVIIMDCDGEDKPSDLVSLIEKSRQTNNIIVAKRGKRLEGISFRIFYFMYKILAHMLTGKKITFGNFMLLPKAEVKKIIHYSEIWNHLAGTIIKSKLPYSQITFHRGKRHVGSSSMNFKSLLLHGLGAIGVFIEIIAARLMIFSLMMILLCASAMLIVVYIKLFTREAIPGWATTVISSLLIVLLQSFLLSLFTIFLFLSSQGQQKIIPAHHFMDYIQLIEANKD